MSYQSTYRSVSNPVHTHPTPSQSSINRRPTTYTTSLRSASPLPIATGTNTKTLRANDALTLSTPLHSFPPQEDTPLYAAAPIATVASIVTSNPPYPSSNLANGSATVTQQSSGSLTSQEIDNAFEALLNIQKEAVKEHSKRPFAALLLAPDKKTILCSHNSISHYQHAESELARLAATQYSEAYLKRCTLVSTWEPCAMCAGTIYWTGIGRLLYAASETKLKHLTGSDNKENLTMTLPCRVVFECGQRDVEIIGPVDGWEQKIVEESEKWWKAHDTDSSYQTQLNNGSKDNASIHSSRTSVTVYNPNDSLLGSVDEDGEYQADLKIDWMMR